MFSAQTYIDRRNKLRKNVKSGIIVLLGNAEAPRNYPSNGYHFRQDSTFLYYFGLDHADLVGVIDIEADTDCIYGNDYTIDDIIWMGEQPLINDLAAQVGVKKSYPMSELQRTVTSAIRKGRKVHFLPPYRLENAVKIASLQGIHTARVSDYSSKELIRAVVAQREIKSSEEIAQIEEACEIGYRMHTAAMKMCRPGIYEREIAGEIEGIALKYGSGVSFHSIVTQHGETLHNHYHGNKLEAGRLLLCDAGAETTMNYCSDFTRTIPITGKFTDKQKEIYNIVLAANQKSQECARAGITYQSVHMEAVKVMAEGLHALGLIKGNIEEALAAGVTGLFMPHGLGHQMGLDVHDMEDFGENYVGYDDITTRSTQFGLGSLRMGKTLREGHVVTTEPGCYFVPALIRKWEREHINSAFINFQKLEQYMDFGGVRIEDDILITANGCRKLGKHHVPTTVDEVEAIVGK